MATTPGDEGKWFATAKEAGLLDEAIWLANQAPCDPKTLTRAARDFGAVHSELTVEAGPGHASLAGRGPWLRDHERRRVGGVHGDDERGGEGGRAEEARARIRTLVASETSGERFVSRTLGRALGL